MNGTMCIVLESSGESSPGYLSAEGAKLKGVSGAHVMMDSTQRNTFPYYKPNSQ